VGIRRALRLIAGTDLARADASVNIGGGDVAQVAHLPAGVAQAFGINTDTDTVTRAQAMSVPAMRRGRQVIAGTLGALPLAALRTTGQGDTRRVERVEDGATATLLEQPDPNVTRAATLTWTLDDLIFYPCAWWRVLDRDGSTGYPTHAERIRPDRVTVDTAAGRVYVDGVHVPDSELIRFDGPDEGVLTHGARTLRTCLRLEDAVRRLSLLDIPLGVFTPEEGAEELDDDEIDALLAAWTEARRTNNWAYINNAVKAQPFQFDARALQLAELRLYQTGEIARLLNLPPRMVNAPNATGMTYSNSEADRRELVDLALAPYIAAVEQRLSMGDVTPRGQRVAFDLAAFLQGTTAEILEAASVGIAAGVLGRSEVRTEWLKRPAALPAADTPPPQVAPREDDDA